MATQTADFGYSLSAAADLSSYPLRFAKLSAANTATYQDTAGAACIGVIDDDPPSAAGRAVGLQVGPVVRVTAGAAVAAGAYVKSDTVGRAITASAAVVDTSDGGAAADPVIGSHVQGVALEAAGAAGDIIKVLRIGGFGAVPTTAA